MIQIGLGILGLAAGGVTAAGVFAVITVIGIIPRLAGKTHTAKWIHWYEWAVILGGVLGNVVDLFQIPIGGGVLFVALFGFGSGMFVSCLIMSLAEVLDVFPILCRRVRLTVGIPYIILGLALGKTVGSLLFFYQGLG